MKKYLTILLAIILIFSINTICFAANQTITNGNNTMELTNLNSKMINNRLFISLSDLTEFLDNDIIVKTSNNEIKLYNLITLNTAYNMNNFGYYNNISSIQTKIDASPTKINGKIYVPLRYVLYSLGYIIDTHSNNFECKYIGVQDSTFGEN